MALRHVGVNREYQHALDMTLSLAGIWASRGDDALGTPSPRSYYLNERKLARSSSEKDCGCSHAAKWPPFAIRL
jgi:hypothetical protein